MTKHLEHAPASGSAVEPTRARGKRILAWAALAVLAASNAHAVGPVSEKAVPSRVQGTSAGAVAGGVPARPNIEEFSLPAKPPFPPFAPYAIALGSDGSMWFTEYAYDYDRDVISGASIGRISTDGVFQEFALPTGNVALDSIARGPDGNLWFTGLDWGSDPGQGLSLVGRITPEGVISEFPLLRDTDPGQIMAGPDGELWFTTSAGIAEISTEGELTEFPLPYNTYGIAAGPDGNVWFTEPYANKIGRITTSGIVTEFPIPTASSGVLAIAAGPDGNLWFTEPTVNKIGRISTQGAVTEFGLPILDSFPAAIAAGANGNVWFTQISSQSIGEIDLGHFGAVDLSVGPDAQTRVLRFDGTSGLTKVDNLDATGAISETGPFGPFAGWAPGAIDVGSDGVTRVLWNNTDGAAGLWLGPLGSEGSFRFDAMFGWSAVDVAAAVSGATHILWTQADGRIAIWTVGDTGHVSTGPDYGPFPDSTAVAMADGRDDLSRILWTKSDGTASLWFLRSQGLATSAVFGPVPGWRAIDIAVGADSLTRMLWTRSDGRMGLWTVDSTGTTKTRGPAYAPPQGFTAARIAAGPDGLIRVLWTSPNGGTIVWTMSPDNVFQKSFPVNSASDSSVSDTSTATSKH